MNINSSEKKWFVYLRNQQEGPFSLEEIESKLKSAQISTATYLWADGMPDWAPLHTALPGMMGLEMDLKSAPQPPQPIRPAPAVTTRKRSLNFKVLGFLALIAASLVVSAMTLPGARTQSLRIISLTAKAAAPYIAQFATSNAALLELVSDIPSLPDIDAAGLSLLRKTSLTQYEKNPATLVIVPVIGSSNHTFYFGSGLPNGTRIEMRFSGIPETLLGSLEASAVLQAEIKNHLARVDLLTPLPAGSYRVSVTQPPFAETLFIGQKDEAYENGLRDFHAKIRIQASQELMEIRSAIQLMEADLAQTKKNITWANDVLNANVAKWSSAEFLKASYYSSLFQLSAQVSQVVIQYNNFKNTAADKKGDRGSMEIRAGETLSAAQSALMNLKSKLDLAERVAAASELPEREGL
jgi:hypothetical protein